MGALCWVVLSPHIKTAPPKLRLFGNRNLGLFLLLSRGPLQNGKTRDESRKAPQPQPISLLNEPPCSQPFRAREQGLGNLRGEQFASLSDSLFDSEMKVFEDVLLNQGSDNKKRKSLNSYLSNKETE